MGRPVSPTARGRNKLRDCHSGVEGKLYKGFVLQGDGPGCACVDHARLEGLEGAWLGGSRSLTGINLGPENLIPTLALPF